MKLKINEITNPTDMKYHDIIFNNNIVKVPKVKGGLVKFECTGCGYCCITNKDIALTFYDMDRITSNCKAIPELNELEKSFYKKSEDVTIDLTTSGYLLKMIPLKNPVMINGIEFKEKCIFYDETKKNCKIYESRPAICRRYPLDWLLIPPKFEIKPKSTIINGRVFFLLEKVPKIFMGFIFETLNDKYVCNGFKKGYMDNKFYDWLKITVKTMNDDMKEYIKDAKKTNFDVSKIDLERHFKVEKKKITIKKPKIIRIFDDNKQLQIGNETFTPNDIISSGTLLMKMMNLNQNVYKFKGYDVIIDYELDLFVGIIKNGKLLDMSSLARNHIDYINGGN